MKRLSCLFVLSFLAAGCGGSQTQSLVSRPADWQEPKIVTVQHILIGFQGSLPGKNVTRSQAEAETLANDLLSRARAGEDFDALVEEYSDDNYPGVYQMANRGETADKDRLVFERGQMAQYFGDVSFSLEVNAFGLAPYHKDKCKYGWHIIKRLK
jgi:PPIC-type PPIASE domain